jgi:hypothetical protein
MGVIPPSSVEVAGIPFRVVRDIVMGSLWRRYDGSIWLRNTHSPVPREVIGPESSYGGPLMRHVSVGPLREAVGRYKSGFRPLLQDTMRLVGEMDSLLASKVLNKMASVDLVHGVVRPRPCLCEIGHDIYALEVDRIDSDEVFPFIEPTTKI